MHRENQPNAQMLIDRVQSSGLDAEMLLVVPQRELGVNTGYAIECCVYDTAKQALDANFFFTFLKKIKNVFQLAESDTNVGLLQSCWM